MLNACPPAMAGTISAQYVLYIPSEVTSLNPGTMFATPGYIIRSVNTKNRKFEPGILKRAKK